MSNPEEFEEMNTSKTAFSELAIGILW